MSLLPPSSPITPQRPMHFYVSPDGDPFVESYFQDNEESEPELVTAGRIGLQLIDELKSKNNLIEQLSSRLRHIYTNPSPGVSMIMSRPDSAQPESVRPSSSCDVSALEHSVLERAEKEISKLDTLVAAQQRQIEQLLSANQAQADNMGKLSREIQEQAAMIEWWRGRDMREKVDRAMQAGPVMVDQHTETKMYGFVDSVTQMDVVSVSSDSTQTRIVALDERESQTATSLKSKEVQVSREAQVDLEATETEMLRKELIEQNKYFQKEMRKLQKHPHMHSAGVQAQAAIAGADTQTEIPSATSVSQTDPPPAWFDAQTGADHQVFFNSDNQTDPGPVFYNCDNQTDPGPTFFARDNQTDPTPIYFSCDTQTELVPLMLTRENQTEFPHLRICHTQTETVAMKFHQTQTNPSPVFFHSEIQTERLLPTHSAATQSDPAALRSARCQTEPLVEIKPLLTLLQIKEVVITPPQSLDALVSAESPMNDGSTQLSGGSITPPRRKIDRDGDVMMMTVKRQEEWHKELRCEFTDTVVVYPRPDTIVLALEDQRRKNYHLTEKLAAVRNKAVVADSLSERMQVLLAGGG